MGFKILGKVIEKETGKGIPNLTVKAIDKDLFSFDILGAVTTEENGNFEIKYDKDDFQELFFDKKPDIYLKIVNPDGEVIHTTKDKIRYEAGETEGFDIIISEKKIENEQMKQKECQEGGEVTDLALISSSRYQIKNLLDFLNELITPSDLAAIFPSIDKKIGRSLAKNIIMHRLKYGSFISLEDLAKVPNIDHHVMQLLLNEARHPIVSAMSRTFYDIPYTYTHLTHVLMLPFGGILPSVILWEPIPEEWLEKKWYSFKYMLQWKEELINERIEAATKDEIKKRREKETKERIWINVIKGMPENEIAQKAAEDEFNVADKAHKLAKKKKKDLKNEKNKLNDKIDASDLLGVWNIIKENYKNWKEEKEEERKEAKKLHDTGKMEEIDDDLEDKKGDYEAAKKEIGVN